MKTWGVKVVGDGLLESSPSASGRGSAKSVGGGLMSGVVGVLVRVRRGPAGTMGSA